MSSGQKAWDEEQEELSYIAHKKRINALGVNEIIKISKELESARRCLEKTITSLPREGWSALDDLKININKLR